MVYIFEPTYVNSTIFLFDRWHLQGDWGDYIRQNKPIPASRFPKSLNIADASQQLPDMFRPSHTIILSSERARVVLEQLAPGQVEFIPVSVNAAPQVARRLQLTSAYYFINVLGRAQRLQWLEMPIRPFRQREDGTEITTMEHDFRRWKLRERAEGEPLIWHDDDWRDGNKLYAGHSRIFIEDALWRGLDQNFPNQLNVQRVDSYPRTRKTSA